MAFLLGFLIAFAIGVTGVGAGTVTAPLLILALGLPPEVAVGTALLFGFLVKVPAGAVYLLRRQVDARALLRLLLGGVPGVLLGSLLLTQLKGAKDLVLLLVGLTVVLSAGLGLWRGLKGVGRGRERPWLLPPASRWASLPPGPGPWGPSSSSTPPGFPPRRWWAPTSSSASSSPSWGAGSTSPSARWPQASSSPWPRAGWRGGFSGPSSPPGFPRSP